MKKKARIAVSIPIQTRLNIPPQISKLICRLIRHFLLLFKEISRPGISYIINP